MHTDLIGGIDSIRGLVLQADGKLVAAGTAFPFDGTGPDFALARYDLDGSLDPSFGIGGKVTTDFAGHLDQANAVALQADGKVVAAGVAETGGGFAYAAARYRTDGTLDPRFGVGGKVTADPTAGTYQEAYDLVVRPDGKLVLVGSPAQRGGWSGTRADGTLDPRFGGDGIVTNEQIGGTANAVAVQADGSVVVAGSATSQRHPRLRPGPLPAGRTARQAVRHTWDHHRRPRRLRRRQRAGRAA